MTKEEMWEGLRRGRTIVQEDWTASQEEIIALDEIFASGDIVLSPWERSGIGSGSRVRRGWMRFDGDAEAQYVIGMRTWRTMQGAPRDGKPVLIAARNRVEGGVPEIMVWRTYRQNDTNVTTHAWQCPISRAGQELRPRVIVKMQEDQYLWLPCPRLQGGVPVSDLDAPAERDRVPVEEPIPAFVPRRVVRKIS